MSKIDLHMHSLYSDDGEFSMQQLVDIAHQGEIEYIAIADHNNAKVHLNKVDKMSVKIVPAIELDVSFQDKDFHLLGYGIDPNNPRYKEIEKEIVKQELVASKERLKKVREEMNLFIDDEKLRDLCPDGIYIGEALCEVAMQDERNKGNPYLKEYYPGGERSDNPYVNFYWDYCSKGKIAYSFIEFISLKEAINLYHQQGALIVLAHPGNNVKEDDQLLKDIIDLGIDGLEVYSSYHDEKQVDYYTKVAINNDLIITCGSDFHGKTKPSIKMGDCTMPIILEEKLIEIIKAYI